MGEGSAQHSALKKPPKDPIREERIHEEAIVDAYGSEEKAMSWYYCLEGKLSFPFQARCSFSRVVSPLKKGESVEVRRMSQRHAGANSLARPKSGRSVVTTHSH